MRDATSHDMSRLMRVIAALSAKPEKEPVAARSLAKYDQSGATLADLILSEIDETVLRRRLAFRRDEEEIVLDVTERRIVAALSLPASLALSGKDIANRQLSSSDGPALMLLLHRFCDGATDITVRSLLPAKNKSAAVNGVSISDLKRYRENLNEDQENDRGLASVVEATKSMAQSIVMMQANEVGLKFGAPEGVDALTQIYQQSKKAHDRGSVRSWQFGEEGACGLIVCQFAETWVGVLLDGEHLPACFPLWQSVLGTEA